MNRYVATFHTHLSAMLTCRVLTDAGMEARMAPVPRSISSSCGTCVFYTAQGICRELLDEDTERVYEQRGETYTLLLDLENGDR